MCDIGAEESVSRGNPGDSDTRFGADNTGADETRKCGGIAWARTELFTLVDAR